MIFTIHFIYIRHIPFSSVLVPENQAFRHTKECFAPFFLSSSLSPPSSLLVALSNIDHRAESDQNNGETF